MELVLALDAGTSSVRAVAFDERFSALGEVAYDLPAAYPAPGEVEQDAHEILRLSRRCLEEVTARVRRAGHEVVALGITNQRETTVAFDRATGRALRPALGWQDRRTAARCAELEAAGEGPRVRATTGLVLDAYFSATKMQWLSEAGALEGARDPAFATIDAWLLWHLTGGVEGGELLSEASNASRTMLLDLATMAWSPAMLKLFGLDAATLPSLRPSCGPFGVIAASASTALAGVPITGVLGDQQAALFGQACFEPGVVKATYGTGAFVLVNAGSSVPPVVDGLITTVAWDLGAEGRAYALEGSAFVAGAAVQWLRDVGLLGASHELEALARDADSSLGARFVPAFTGLGSPFWRPEARGAILGLSRGVNRAALARSLVDALAFEVRAITDAFRDGGVELRELRADGGAAAMDLLLELQATNSRLPVRRGVTLEATARGAASVAALGAGRVGSLGDLAATWRDERRFEPGEPTSADLDYAHWLTMLERA